MLRLSKANCLWSSAARSLLLTKIKTGGRKLCKLNCSVRKPSRAYEFMATTQAPTVIDALKIWSKHSKMVAVERHNHTQTGRTIPHWISGVKPISFLPRFQQRLTFDGLSVKQSSWIIDIQEINTCIFALHSRNWTTDTNEYFAKHSDKDKIICTILKQQRRQTTYMKLPTKAKKLSFKN